MLIEVKLIMVLNFRLNSSCQGAKQFSADHRKKNQVVYLIIHDT